MPAGNHLFKIAKACVKLCKIDKIMFHWLVAKLIFMSKCAQPDIQPTIAFITTRVLNPDEDGWKTLRRVLLVRKTSMLSSR